MLVAVDIGGTKIRAAAFQQAGGPEAPKALARCTIPSTNRYDQDMAQLVLHIKDILAKANQLAPSRLQGIGVAVAGRLELGSTPSRLKMAGNLTSWVNHNMWADLYPHFKCPIYFLNDAQAAGLGEANFGLQSAKDFWFVVWSTGVGGSLVRRSASPNQAYVAYASELGHALGDTADGLVIDCPCGQVNCLETRAGGRAIERLYGVPADQLSDDDWPGVLSAMSQGLRNLLSVQPTELIVFGGSVALNQPRQLAKLRQGLAANLRSAEVPRFEVARLGDDAGLLGALVRAAG